MQNAATRLTDDHARWRVSEADALAFSNAVASYVTTYQTFSQAKADGTRSKSLTAAKDAARLNAIELMQPIYFAVQKSREISDEDKILIGVKVPDRNPTPEPSPATQVLLTLVSVVNRTAKVTLRNAGSENTRKRPFGASGASVFYCVGPEPKPPGDGWFFAGNATKPTVEVALSQAPVESTTVWICAMWYGTRGELGPVGPAIRVDLPAIQNAPMVMKLAA